MRVALFFDGKNHMKDLRRTAQDKWIDHGALADWTVKHVDGSRFVGAYYYTGVPTAQDEGHERHALTDLLEELERRPGFFVKRFNRRTATRECPHCNEVITYTEEKMVDTSLVTDLVVLGMQDAFDCAVVFTGDLDVAPGLAAVRALGKQAWIATFGDFGLSKSLTREAWAHIDLLPHIDRFAHPELEGAPKPEVVAPLASDVDGEVLRELRRAEAHFAAGGGFVGAHYFIHRWKGHGIPEAPDARRLALQRLMMLGRVVSYSVDGKTAIRTAEGAVPLDELKVLSSPSADEDETTVELRRAKIHPAEFGRSAGSHPAEFSRSAGSHPAEVDRSAGSPAGSPPAVGSFRSADVPDLADLRSDRVGESSGVTRRLRVRAED